MKKLLVREAVEQCVGCKAYKMYIEKLKRTKVNGWEYRTTVWKIKFCFWVNDTDAAKITDKWNWENEINEESLNHYLPICDSRITDTRYEINSRPGFLGIIIYTDENPSLNTGSWSEAFYLTYRNTNKLVNTDSDYYAWCVLNDPEKYKEYYELKYVVNSLKTYGEE